MNKRGWTEGCISNSFPGPEKVAALPLGLVGRPPGPEQVLCPLVDVAAVDQVLPRPEQVAALAIPDLLATEPGGLSGAEEVAP